MNQDELNEIFADLIDKDYQEWSENYMKVNDGENEYINLALINEFDHKKQINVQEAQEEQEQGEEDAEAAFDAAMALAEGIMEERYVEIHYYENGKKFESFTQLVHDDVKIPDNATKVVINSWDGSYDEILYEAEA